MSSTQDFNINIQIIISLNVLVDAYHHKVTILDVLYMYYSQYYINLVSEDEDPPDQSSNQR